MNDEKYIPNDLRELLLRNKIATLDELKTVLKTNSTMTVFRKLKQLEYISSYSHRGKYYSLDEIAEYDPYGIWSHQSVWFSKYGNLVETVKDLIDTSSAGYTAKELENIVHVEAKHALLNLFKNKRADREKIGNVLVYYSVDKTGNKRQRLNRQQLSEQIHFDLACEIDTHSHELKAAIILLFSLLDEKQRRLFAGLESFKIGHGGDKRIADLLGLDVHTVAKGRREIFSGSVQFEGVRKKGSGRTSVEKKFRRSSQESND
jgi:hypothetical protein